MSKLAELLQSRGAATSATSATYTGESSNCSKSSSPSNLVFNSELEYRVRQMAKRWKYTSTELAEVLQAARREPSRWLPAITVDEQREAEFRERGFLPRIDA